MSKPRHRAREIALQILYHYDVAAHSSGITAPKGAQLAEELRKHFDHFAVPDGLREFAAELVAGCLGRMDELDRTLELHAANWKVSRMGFVDRSLLRMALYELLFISDTPPSVVIDEAVELAKQFGTADTPSFVNGILDSVRKSLPEGTQSAKSSRSP